MHQGIISQIKNTLSIYEAWRRLGFPNAPEKDGPCRSPFREDRHASFSIREGGRKFKDFAGEGGDVIDFIQHALQVDRSTALRIAREWSGLEPLPPLPPPRSSAGLTLPPLRAGEPSDFQAVARARRVNPAAVALASRLGVLKFGESCGHASWILTDAKQRIAEARRIDGKEFPAFGTLTPRKAHTLKGSSKSWPAGVALLAEKPFRAVMLVEGGPDYLAALHFIIELGAGDVIPVAMLGRGAGVRIDAEALALLAGRRARIYPHADADGGGMTAAEMWATQLHGVGCDVDFFTFGGLTRRDGKPAKDLNDAAVITPAQQHELSSILP